MSKLDKCPDRDHGDAAEALHNSAVAAAWALLAVIPKTPAGVLALATYAGDVVKAGDDWPEEWDLGLFTAIVEASATWRQSRES